MIELGYDLSFHTSIQHDASPVPGTGTSGGYLLTLNNKGFVGFGT
jgi:hypothetical protein